MDSQRVVFAGICTILFCLPCFEGMNRAKAVEPLVTQFGLGTILHPLQVPAEIPLRPGCDRFPAQCEKDHVYTFCVNGLNPLCLGNFNGLCTYLRQQGYANTYFGQLYTSHGYAAEIRRIRACDPQAKIVLVGFSLGANYVKLIANCLEKDHTRVDLLVYLVGDTVFNTSSSYPSNVCRVVNVRARGLVLTGGDLFFHGAEIDGARNDFVNTRHILVPSRCETLTLLMEELNTLAIRHE